MNGVTGILINILGFLGIGWYFFCIVVIGFQLLKASTDQPPPPRTDFRAFMALSITTISTALATFVGVLLGFQVVANRMDEHKGRIRMEGAYSDPGVSAILKDTERLMVTPLQVIAAISYLASIGLALFCWWLKGDDSDPTVVKLGQSILGLIAGALTVLLNGPGP